jgi:hypothetical protein
MSGSFLTNKPDPNDVDCVYVIDHEAWQKGLHTPAAGFLLAVAQSDVKSLFGLHVDSYVLEWVPTAGATPTAAAQPYHMARGYWDDLWVRQRDLNPRLDAIPRRGYLEVMLDGYQ